MSTPYFSIIIPTLNEEKFIPKLLLNLNQQSYKDFEVIVVDGQSEDETQSIVKQFPTTFLLTCIVSNKRNVSHQRNLGASGAKGKVLIFFDADTQIPKNYLEKINYAFETKKPHVLSTWMKADSKSPSDQFIATASNLIMETARIIGNPGCFGAMTAIKKGVFEDIGGYDEKTPFAEDRQLILNAINYHYQFIILPKPSYIYSLRRFRAEGTLDTLLDTLKINLSIMAKGYHLKKVNYPMGGHNFVKDELSGHSGTWINEITNKVKKLTKKQRHSIQNLYNRFFPYQSS